MKITNIGGATAIIEHNGKRMLFDPWMDDGIFHGSWYHYPPSRVSIDALGHLDYVYISHIHEDHCSAGTIKHLNTDAEIIIMDKKPNFVAKFLDNNQFEFKRVNLVKPRSPVELAPGLIVDMIEGDPANPMSHAIDSIMVLKWDNFVLVNANDCSLYKDAIDYIKATYKKVDFALLPYGGGSGYPSCYQNLTHEEKLNEKNKIMMRRFDSFVECTNELSPTFVMPFADQYVVAGSRDHLNKYISHPIYPGVVAEYIKDKPFNSELILLNSAQSFDFDTLQTNPSEPFQAFTEKDQAKYLEGLKQAKYDHEHFRLNPSVALDRLVAHARSRMWEVQNKRGYHPEFKFYLDATDSQRRFEIDLSQAQSKEVSYFAKLEQPYLKMSVPDSLLMFLLVGHVSWNIADAALFIDYDRVPNVYDGKIYEFLNYLKV